jgi:hypothetical protein
MILEPYTVAKVTHPVSQPPETKVNNYPEQTYLVTAEGDMR